MKRISFHKALAFFYRNERGIGLLETLVAITIIGACGVGFLAAMSTSTEAVDVTEKKVDVDNLARSQLEYTKNSPYVIGATSYTALDELDSTDPSYITIPRDYDIIVSSGQLPGSSDEDIQLITVTIQHEGKNLLQLDGYKVNR